MTKPNDQPTDPTERTELTAAHRAEALDQALAMAEPARTPAPDPAEVDPLEVFLSAGHAAVQKLTAELEAVGEARDDLLARAEALDVRFCTIKSNRDRIESAVLAAIASLEGPRLPAPDPELSPEAVEEITADQTAPKIVVRPAKGGTTRLATRNGYVPRPGKVSQRQWLLDRLVREGKLVIQDVVEDFAAEYEIGRDAAIKNISSAMYSQMKHPNPTWPVPIRMRPGTFTLSDS